MRLPLSSPSPALSPASRLAPLPHPLYVHQSRWQAAKAAGMRCIITYTDSTASEDFYAQVRAHLGPI